MKILILGSTGYLGCKLVRKLVDKHEICCLKLAEDNAVGLTDIKDTVNIVNIDDFYKMNESFDCLVNLSCRYSREGVRDIDIFESNLYAPLRVFLKAMDSGIHRHITIDTSLPEDLNVYSLSKKKYAEILKWYADRSDAGTNGLGIVNVQLENYYGEDEPEDRFIPSTIIKLRNNEDVLLTEGNQKRDWIYVEDVIDALVSIIENDDITGYLDLPLGTGESVEVRKVIKYLKEMTGSHSQLCFGAIPKRNNEPDTCADTSVMNEYGIRIRYRWKDGFKKLI